MFVLVAYLAGKSIPSGYASLIFAFGFLSSVNLMMIAAGWDAEGVDVAQHLVDWGRLELGVSLGVGGISSLEGGGTYSAITMWDYIEHSLDPAGELAKCKELLEPGGLVALSTGDRDSIVARLTRSRWHLLTPRHHNFFFSEQTLTVLLDRQGFELVLVRPT